MITCLDISYVVGLLSLFIGMLLYAFLPISRMIFWVAYYINATITFASKYTSTLVTSVIMVIETLLLAFVPFCLGGVGEK